MTKLKTLAIALAALPAMAAWAETPVAVAQPTQATALDHIVAIVNHDVITERELRDRIHSTALNLRRQGVQLPSMPELRKQVLDRMITEHVILQRAAETGISVDANVVNATIMQIAQQNNLTPQELAQELTKDGSSIGAFQEEIRNQLITQRLREREVDANITIPESEVNAFLAEQAGFVGEDPTQYHVAHILLPFDKTMTESEAKAEAERLVKAAKTPGEDFEKLVVANSKASDALSGGDLGWRDAQNLPTEFWAAIKANPRSGSVYSFKSAHAWHVVKLLGTRDGVQHKLSGGPVERTHVRHILMTVSDVTPEDQILRRLTDLRQRLVEKPDDFATVARLNSVDGSATRGGDLGWVEPGDMVPQFEEAMNKLKPGEISPIVRTPYGYHLIQVEGRQVDKDGSPERLRAQARQAIGQKKLAEAAYDWERRLRDEAYVDIRQDVDAQ